MSRFRDQLQQTAPDPGRRWIFVPYDQLSPEGLVGQSDPNTTGLLLIESRAKGSRRPYHRQKLALVLTNLRHFAIEQQRRGFQIHYLTVDTSYAEAIADLDLELGPIEMMRPAEFELREELTELFDSGRLVEKPNTLWATEPDDFLNSVGSPPWRMDSFYRYIRRRYGWLMIDGKPEGGRFSFDGENRKAWKGTPAAPAAPHFEPDDLTLEVCEQVETLFPHHPGVLTPRALPASAEDAGRLWAWALAECLESFGPYEDAMSLESRGLFHTRVSPLVNLGRLHPLRLARDVIASDAPLASREGFLRQIVGWREFMRHVHETTQGFREVGGETVPTRPTGDGGFAKWTRGKWEAERKPVSTSPAPTHLEVERDLPAAFWGTPSGLNCLDVVVSSVWEEGWSHHITRLMILSNLASLLDVDPRQITDWFWVAYIDAFDWVVEPNVLGMGTFSLGPLLTTKPYISGAAYIHRMSDYCSGCRFHPKRNCPITPLYWAYLARHQEKLEPIQRIRMPLRSLAKRDPKKRRRDREVFEQVTETLAQEQQLHPDDFET